MGHGARSERDAERVKYSRRAGFNPKAREMVPFHSVPLRYRSPQV